MVGNSKILTVSYGTFSCTLEGFDDSFDTMKAIAEYFRDLAADDRYFGAEPPQPDAEMLARIAERELARSVTARADGNRVMLSPTQEPAEAVSDAPAENAETQPVEEAEKQDAADAVAEAKAETEAEASAPVSEPVEEEAEAPIAEAVEDDEAAEDDSQETAEAEAEAPAVADAEEQTDLQAEDDAQAEEVSAVDVEAKDAKADAEVEAKDADTEVSAEAKDEDEDEDADADVEAVDAEAEDEAEDTSAEVTEAETADAPEETSVRDAIAALTKAGAEKADEAKEDDAKSEPAADLPAEAEVDADPAALTGEIIDPEPEAKPKPAAGSIAAKLARIRAVVSRGGARPNGYTEDEHAEDFSPADRAADAADADPAKDTDAASASDADEVAQTVAAKLASETATDAEPAPAAPRKARVLKMKRADFEAAVARGQLQAASKDMDLAKSLGAGKEDDPALAAAEEADLDDAFEDTMDETRNDSIFANVAERDGLSDLDSGSFDPETNESGLTEEEEADLMRELAAAEEEAAGADHADAAVAAPEAIEGAEADTGEDAGDDADESASNADGRKVLEQDVPADGAVDRLLEQTNAQMDEPEGKTRRQAFTQLKAAVAATEAARKMGDDASKEDDGNKPYKEDLDQVVRPRRATKTASKKSERPTPPPLKLVASQRVDTPASEPETVASKAVQPRRIPSTPAQAAEDYGNFRNFATTVGATGLPDLVEAAASYTALVDGNDVFSRPMVMRKVAAVMGDDYRREDGLRAFGTLLRAGKIEKIKGGQFKVTDNTGFKPERRAVI